MKTVFGLGIIALALTTTALAEPPKAGAPAAQHSREFEKLESLEGKWEGTMMHDGKPESVSVTYHLTSGGSAIIETLFPGTPHEMVSVYHDERGKLAMTHYCMVGNRPKLEVRNSTPTEIDLGFAKDNTIDTKTEDYMSGLHITFIDRDDIVQHWSGVHAGKEKDPAIFKLARVQ